MSIRPQYAYISAAVLVVGTAIVRQEWLPVAVAVGAILGALGFFSTGSNPAASVSKLAGANGKVLKPDEFQLFKLTEKNVLSHNTAMYV